MIQEALVLLAALAVLAKSSEWVIEHVMVIARFLRVSEFAIGSVLVAVATSLPEFVVAIVAGLGGEHALPVSVGNVLGANIADLLLVIGASALVGRVVIKKHETRSLLAVLALAALLPLALFLTWAGQIVGFLLLVCFLVYGAFIFKQKTESDLRDGAPVSFSQALTAALFFTVGIVLVVGSARFALDSAVSIAESFGLSKILLGATLVAIGTTLPELAVGLAAVKKRRSSLAIGNAVGSCIVNLTLVLGTGLFLAPVVLDAANYAVPLVFVFLSCALVGFFVLRRENIGRLQAVALLALYALFLLASFALGNFF